jgi:hypothetical protein
VGRAVDIISRTLVIGRAAGLEGWRKVLSTPTSDPVSLTAYWPVGLVAVPPDRENPEYACDR